MEKDVIIDWLNSRNQDWPAGLALLSQCSAKKYLLRVLTSKGCTAKTHARLRYELSRIVKTKIVVPAKHLKARKPAVSGYPIKNVKTRLYSTNNLQVQGELTGDPYLDDLTARKNSLHSQAMALKHHLEFLAQPDRGISARRSLDLFDERDIIWRQIDYYTKFKIKPPDAISSTDPSFAKLTKKRANLRTYISKIRKRLADPSKSGSKDKYELDLAVKLMELAELDRQINF